MRLKSPPGFSVCTVVVNIIHEIRMLPLFYAIVSMVDHYGLPSNSKVTEELQLGWNLTDSKLSVA